MTYTDEQLRDFARKVIEVDVQDPDFIGVGEQFEEEWAHLSPDEFDEVRSKVHSLACSAVVDVTFPGEQSERDRLAEQVKRVRDVHRPVSAWAGDPDDDDNLTTACMHCEVPYPCDTIRALDGTEAGS